MNLALNIAMHIAAIKTDTMSHLHNKPTGW